MKNDISDSAIRMRLRKAGAALFGAAVTLAVAASAFAAEPVTLRVGDQKGGNRSLLKVKRNSADVYVATITMGVRR